MSTSQNKDLWASSRGNGGNTEVEMKKQNVIQVGSKDEELAMNPVLLSKKENTAFRYSKFRNLKWLAFLEFHQY